MQGEIIVKKEKVAKATINQERSCLSRMFSLVVDWGYLDVNPIKKVKRYNEPLKKVKPLTIEQEEKLLEDWAKIPEAKHAVLIFLIALYGGMRLSEVMQLEKDNINLDEGTIAVDITKSGNPKLIYMNERLTELIKEAIKEGNYFHFAESDFVFINPKTGKPYTSIKTTLAKALKRVGLNNFTFHHTRHTFCSRLVEAGVDEVTIMEQGGWKTRSMINRYAHPSPEHKRSAMKKLDSGVLKSVPLLFDGIKEEGKESVTICNIEDN